MRWSWGQHCLERWHNITATTACWRLQEPEDKCLCCVTLSRRVTRRHAHTRHHPKSWNLESQYNRTLELTFGHKSVATIRGGLMCSFWCAARRLNANVGSATLPHTNVQFYPADISHLPRATSLLPPNWSPWTHFLWSRAHLSTNQSINTHYIW